jgi:4'-phosphopantetheinyl transferase
MTRSNPWISKADWTPLPKGEIDVWKFSLALRENDRNILSQDELERFDRTDSKPKHERKIAGRAQLRRILSLYTSTDPSEISFEYGQNQKPLLPKHSDLSFNLSHSGNMGLVAVTYSRRVGIDLEYLEAERPFSKIAERFLTKSENDFINGYPEEERSRAFYRIWTLNEAYLKALGTGLSVSSNDFSIVPNDSKGKFLKETTVPGDVPQNWIFETLEAGPAHIGVVCFEAPLGNIRYWNI